MTTVPFLMLCLALNSTALPNTQSGLPKVTVATAGQTKQKPLADQRGTAQQPAVVEIIGPPDSSRAAKEAATERAAHAFKESVAAYSTLGLALLTLALAIATGILARYTWRLWKTTGQMMTNADTASANVLKKMEDQRDAMNTQTHSLVTSSEKTLVHLTDSAERDLRGYVFFDKQAHWDPSTIHLEFKNSGRTPVKDVEVLGYLTAAPEVRTGPLEMKAAERVTEVSKVALPPQGAIDVAFGGQPSLSANSRLVQAGHIWYVHGIVKYIDAYARQRTTTFRFSLNASKLASCDEGNDWD